MAPEKEHYEDLPQSLIEGLKAADRPVPVITARVDREISKMARRQFAGRRQPIRVPRSAWAAIAATVLVAVLALQLRGPTPGQSIYADVDGSGRIDIADVLAVARAQAPGERSHAELDAFAYRIVALEPPRDSS